MSIEAIKRKTKKGAIVGAGFGAMYGGLGQAANEIGHVMANSATHPKAALAKYLLKHGLSNIAIHSLLNAGTGGIIGAGIGGISGALSD